MPAGPDIAIFPSGRSTLVAIGLVALAAAAIAVGRVRVGSRQNEETTAAPGLSPATSGATLIVSGDTTGWIVPCGCTSNQSGGLLRRGTFLAQQRREGSVILADAGGAPAGSSDYQRLKFEAILRGELQMGIAAHNLGGPEAALGADYLRRLEQELAVPFVSANLRDASGALVTKPYRIVRVADLRIVLVGVLSAREKPAGCTVDDPRDAVLAALAKAAGEYDRVVVLAWLPEAELRALAMSLPEAHVVIGGPTGQSLAPQMVGATLVASATNKGKFLACVSLPPSGGSGGWTGSVVEINDQFADDDGQAENLRDFRQELAARDFPATKTGLVSPLSAEAPSSYRVAGSQACEACHAEAFRTWTESNHLHAWETLTAEKAFADPECQRCHTTAYGAPGGFLSVARSADRVGVGCESCHGPSAEHAAQPKKKTPLAARGECIRCHDRENSPRFEFSEYWDRIRHGGHAASDAKSASNR